MFLLLSTINIYSVELKIESGYKNYENSKQKDDSLTGRISISQKKDKIDWLIGMEKTVADTLKPPLKEDLHIEKYFLNLGYDINNKMTLESSFLKISDNIAPTDNGSVYGLGINYIYNENTNLNTRGYFSDFRDFNVVQFDADLIKKYNLNRLKLKFSISPHIIFIDDEIKNAFTKNAQNVYFAPDIKVFVSNNQYFGGLGVSPFKKLFIVTENGTAISHHSMELKKNMMLSLGKNFDKFSIAGKYNYGEADELPINNKNVKINMFTLEYKQKF